MISELQVTAPRNSVKTATTHSIRIRRKLHKSQVYENITSTNRTATRNKYRIHCFPNVFRRTRLMQGVRSKYRNL